MHSGRPTSRSSISWRPVSTRVRGTAGAPVGGHRAVPNEAARGGRAGVQARRPHDHHGGVYAVGPTCTVERLGAVERAVKDQRPDVEEPWVAAVLVVLGVPTQA